MQINTKKYAPLPLLSRKGITQAEPGALGLILKVDSLGSNRLHLPTQNWSESQSPSAGARLRLDCGFVSGRPGRQGWAPGSSEAGKQGGMLPGKGELAKIDSFHPSP